MGASSTASVAREPEETEGNEVSNGFHRDDKDAAVRFWRDIVEASGVDDKVLASECRMSKGYFSKVAAGEQGDLLALVFRVGKKRPELRREFFARLAEHEGIDPVSVAAEQVVIAALRFLRLRGVRVPTSKARMAKASL